MCGLNSWRGIIDACPGFGGKHICLRSCHRNSVFRVFFFTHRYSPIYIGNDHDILISSSPLPARLRERSFFSSPTFSSFLSHINNVIPTSEATGCTSKYNAQPVTVSRRGSDSSTSRRVCHCDGYLPKEKRSTEIKLPSRARKLKKPSLRHTFRIQKYTRLPPFCLVCLTGARLPRSVFILFYFFKVSPWRSINNSVNRGSMTVHWQVCETCRACNLHVCRFLQNR